MTCLAALAATLLVSRAHADEGLWLFNQPPRQTLKKKYQFDLTDSWLAHLQKSSVHFDRASGSLVSPEGLVLTNQHVARRWLEQLSTKGNDRVGAGFYASKRELELPCEGLTLDVLWEIEDVTGRVHSALKPGMTPAQARKARRATICALENESQAKTGLHSVVETLYYGAQYHLYRFKRYTDVRLVFAPEQTVSEVFDVCFFRAYEGGRPARVQHYLHWSNAGFRMGDLVFVSGYPAKGPRNNKLVNFLLLQLTSYAITAVCRMQPSLNGFDGSFKE
jgi:hypothetical protein